jgi:hypothetical protein
VTYDGGTGGCLLEHLDTPDLADFPRWLRPGDVVPGIDVIPLRTPQHEG